MKKHDEFGDLLHYLLVINRVWWVVGATTEQRWLGSWALVPYAVQNEWLKFKAISNSNDGKVEVQLQTHKFRRKCYKSTSTEKMTKKGVTTSTWCTSNRD